MSLFQEWSHDVLNEEGCGCDPGSIGNSIDESTKELARIKDHLAALVAIQRELLEIDRLKIKLWKAKQMNRPVADSLNTR